MNMIECIAMSLRNRPNLDFTALKQAIEQAECTLERISAHIPAPAPPLHYGRNVIYRSKSVEAIVIHLPGYTETPIHDHGDSICCLYVVSGSVVNRIYATPSDTAPEREQRKQAGEFLYCDYGQVHSMYNPGPQRLITFHLYTPPLQNATFYPPFGKQVLQPPQASSTPVKQIKLTKSAPRKQKTHPKGGK
jgi:cysteine dioxygenase